MNHDKIIFYHNPMSRGQVIHRMLEEVGADYEVNFIDWRTNQQKTPEFLAINPMGKLPTIVHRGVVVTEVAAICLYLADAFPEANLAPKIDDPRRGEYYRWLMFAVNCVEAAVIDKNVPRIKPIPESGVGYGSYEKTMSVLEKTVEKGYLLGDQYTAADVYMSSYLDWFFYQKLLNEIPILKSYVARCKDRPAFKRYEEKAKELMD